MKTGYTKAAGYCLVSSAKRDNMRLISVVMGTSSKKARASESQKILNYGFRFYETHELYAANKPILRQRVWQGELKEVGLGLSSPLFITIPRGHQQRLKSSVKLNGRLVAPLQKGQHFGTLQVNFNKQLAVKRPLTVLQDVEEGDMLQWTMDYLLLQFE
jgi:D-alanyl-D-alanine carboxypeptidase (penicillin-binding protein 5/6)